MWHHMTPAEKTDHIVRHGCIGFIRLLATICYSIAWMFGAIWLIVTTTQFLKANPIPLHIHPLVATIILVTIGATIFKYTLVIPGQWIAGTTYDFFNPSDWRHIPQPAPDDAYWPESLTAEEFAWEHAAVTAPKVQCEYCGTLNNPMADHCGERQVRGCGAPIT